MADDTPMTVEATLKGSAAKLLLHLLRVGPGQRHTPAIMRGAGISDRKVFYAAKAQLDELGLWENPTWGCGETPHQVRENPPVVGENPTPVGENPPPTEGKPHTSEGISPTTLTFPQGRVDIVRQVDVPPIQPTLSPRAQCAAADRLPAGGDPVRPTSEFQLRRAVQVEALQASFAHLFAGKTLSAFGAKDLLRAAGDIAEDVYDALEEAAGRGIESPLAYVKKMLEGRRSAPAPTMTSAGGVKPLVHEQEDHTGEMLEYTDAHRREADRIEAILRKRGKGHLLVGGAR